MIAPKDLAARYYRLTGRPLGATGEITEYEAAQKLGLILAPARTAAFDASRAENGRTETFQVKGRAVADDDKYRGRVPKIDCRGEFDAVLLVLLDKSTYEAIEIWRVERGKVISRLQVSGSKARNERSSMGISQFKSVARRVWPVG